MEFKKCNDAFAEFLWFCEAFLKIDGFPGTHGTSSNGAPDTVHLDNEVATVGIPLIMPK